MFDAALHSRARPSVVEDRLRCVVDEFIARRVFVIDFRPHGRRHGATDALSGSAGGHDVTVAHDIVVPSESTADEDPADEDTADEDGVLPEFADVAGLLEAGGEHLAAAREAAVAASMAAARQARALAAFARCRPAGRLDRPDGEIGAAAAATRAARPAVLTAVSEWAVDEVMVALQATAAVANRLLAEAITLDERLPATLAAAENGALPWPHAQVLVDLLGPVTDPAIRAGLETQLLRYAPGHSVPQLRAAGRRAVLRADAAAATARAVLALRDRKVRVYDGTDGVSTLAVSMADPLIAACHAALEAYAEACATPGDTRTKDQRMSDCVADLILNRGSTGLPPVGVRLDIVASVGTLTGGDDPGQINGKTVPAVMIREVAHALGLLPRPITPPEPGPASSPAPAAAPGPAAAPEPAPQPERAPQRAPEPEPVGSSAADRARSGVGELLRRFRLAGTALAERPHVAIVEELSGQLLALTDGYEILRAVTCGRRACRTGTRLCDHLDLTRLPGLGPPAATEAYRPTEPLDRFVRARDRRCRFPGCRARPIRCDLDHTVPWPLGPTSHDNLCCLCRHHHRLSHQAPGWTLRALPDGGLLWTTPAGQTIATHPPRYGTDDHLPNAPAQAAPEAEAAAQVSRDIDSRDIDPRDIDPRDIDLRTRVLGRPARPGDEAAPF